jgi:hypothetical protein
MWGLSIVAARTSQSETRGTFVKIQDRAYVTLLGSLLLVVTQIKRLSVCCRPAVPLMAMITNLFCNCLVSHIASLEEISGEATHWLVGADAPTKI